MSDPNPNGGDPTGGAGDQTKSGGTESLKGKVNEQGIPLDAEERADYYKKLSEEKDTKFKNSSKGAQELLQKTKILEQENERLKSHNPSHKEENVSLSEFNELKQRQEELERKQQVIENKRIFNEQCKSLLDQDEFKNIKNRRDEFEEYAYEDENLNTPIEVLARSFQVVKGLIKSEPPKEEDEGRSGIELGTGGSRHQPANKKGYTSEQASKMRTENPRKYNKLVREGRLIISD